METAMEQRNSLSSSYGQDTSGFGPETDVDTPDEPMGLSKPKAVAAGDEGEVNESGEDSEDGGGWNYYTNGNDKRYSESAQSNEADDMDRKLNPDAPEFVPVASPPTHVDNHLQRFLDTANDDFISSSPQKFRETMDNVDLPDENDFACDVKAADLSKLDNAYETKGEFDLMNGVKPLGDELNGDHQEHVNIRRDVATELFGSDMIKNNEEDLATTNGDNFDDFRRIPDDHQNDGPLDLNRARNLFDGIADNVDPYTSLMETAPKQDDCNPFVVEKVEEELNASFNEDSAAPQVNGNGCDDAFEFKNESVTTTFGNSEVNEIDDPVIALPDDKDATSTSTFDSPIPDDSVSTANATLGSIVPPQLDDSDVTTTNVYDGESTINAGGYEDRKLDDSVSTTDAMMGSEPNTPMRMVNQSTFESDSSGDEGVDDAVVESWMDSGVNKNKENDDPHCMDQTVVEDPEGIIPQVTNKNMPVEEETHQIIEDETKVIETDEKLPVDEPTCLKTTAKVENSVYEQQDLPESDFTSSTHEALMNAALPHTTMDQPEVDLSIQNSYAQQVQEAEESDEDEVKCHAAGLNEFQYENETVQNKSNGFEFEKFDNVHHESEDTHQNSFNPIQSHSGKFNDHHNDFELNQNHSDDFDRKSQDAFDPAKNNYDNLIGEKHHDYSENNGMDQSNLNHTLVINHEIEQKLGESEGVVQQHDHQEADSDEEMHSSMIIHSDVESNPPQPYCSESTSLAADPDMMSRSMTFEENFQNRNMSDSLYVMETSSDYFGDLQKSTAHQEDDASEEPKMPEEQVAISVTKVPESKLEEVNESLKEVQPEAVQGTSDTVLEPKADEQKESSNIADVAIAAAAGATVAATIGAGVVALAANKSSSSTAVKKPESSAVKAKATTKAAPKPLTSKSSAAAPLKKTTTSTTAAKPKTGTSTLSSSRPISAPTRPSTTSRTSTTIRSTTTATTTKTGTKPSVSKTSVTAPRPTSAAPKTPTTPRTSTTLKTSMTPKTPTSPRTATSATLKTTPTLKPTTSPRVSLVSKQTLTNGTAKPTSRPTSAALKKPLTNGTTKLTNGTSKLTNGDASKPPLSKGPVNLATRTSLAPPKLPPKAKPAPKTNVAPPSIPGPIRRPTACAPKKTETATS